MAAMIEIHNLSKRFGQHTAVDDVSFSVDRGEVLGFLGPNGAGKSTTMKMLTGFLPPTHGSARICGHDVFKESLAAKRKLGYLPEGAPLYPDMTPASFLAFIAKIRGFSGAEAKRRVDRVVGEVHLGGVMQQPIDTLSKGFKRRVGLAQAILHDPEVLVLDEPTDGLDPNQKHEVRELIQSMAHEKAIVLSTHILEEVDAVCTRTIIIARGKLVVDCTPKQLAAKSRYHDAVSLDAASEDAARIGKALLTIDGVQNVERAGGDDGRVRFLVLPRKGSQILTAIAKRARDEGWKLDEVRAEVGRLDEVFRELTLTGTDS